MPKGGEIHLEPISAREVYNEYKDHCVNNEEVSLDCCLLFVL